MRTRLSARFGNGSSAEWSSTKIADDRLKTASEKGFGLNSDVGDSREAPTKAATLCEALRGCMQVFGERRADDRGRSDESYPTIASVRPRRRPREGRRDEEHTGIAGDSGSSRSYAKQFADDWHEPGQGDCPGDDVLTRADGTRASLLERRESRKDAPPLRFTRVVDEGTMVERLSSRRFTKERDREDTLQSLS
jgi:hypothetical protein